jgi:predicted phage terminase large subunit-like protein
LPNSAGPARRERALRRRIRLSLEAWARFALAEQGQAPAAHHLIMLRALQALEDGQTRRLMLLLPPGSAKSTYASVLFPAWWMGRNPAGAVIAASHTAALAEHFGRGVRRLLDTHGARLNVFLRADSRAAARFQTESGAAYFATGVQGAVTGRRADLALIDDPVASFEDAASARRREQLWNWYRTELLTRLKPGGRIALVMTRWHGDDLAGRLMDQGGWTVIRLPALAEPGDLLGRAPGEALWPAWESEAEVLAKRDTLGARHFAAMFQQAPLPEAAAFFAVEALKFVDASPRGDAVRGWDLAAGTEAARDPDWTAGVLLVRDAEGGFVVDDVQRVRMGPAALGPFIRRVAEQDGGAVAISLPRDPGQAGLHQAMDLTRQLAGFAVRATPESGAKTARARGVAAQIEAGHVSLRRAPWNRAFIEELTAFPHGPKDDQVDALSRAFDTLSPRSAPARFVSSRFFER